MTVSAAVVTGTGTSVGATGGGAAAAGSGKKIQKPQRRFLWTQKIK